MSDIIGAKIMMHKDITEKEINEDRHIYSKGEYYCRMLKENYAWDEDNQKFTWQGIK